MKRFLSILLSVAMVMTMMPMAFAESVSENGVDFAAETVETADEFLNDIVAELSDDTTAEVKYSTDGTNWTESTLVDAVTAIGTQTGTIKVLRNITLTEGLNIKGDITIIPDSVDVTITRGFANKADPSDYNIPGDAMFCVVMSWQNQKAKLTIGDNSGKILTLDGAKDQYSDSCYGSIIYASGTMNYGKANISLQNVVLTNNANAYEKKSGFGNFGGAVYFNGYVNATLDNVKITNCQSNMGGALYSYDNNTKIQSTITITGCEFSNNEVSSTDRTSSKGGAVYIPLSGTKIAISDTKFIENAAKSGSALYFETPSFDEQITLKNCTFSKNKAVEISKVYVAAHSYSRSSSVYFSGAKTEKSVVLSGTFNFDDSTNSDLCLYAYDFSAGSKYTMYLEDDFASNSGIRVMVGAYAVASDVADTYNIPIFKCSSAEKAAKYAALLIPADDGDGGLCNKASQVTFVQDATDTTGISLDKYVEPEVTLTYTPGLLGATEISKNMTYVDAITELSNATSPYSITLTALKDFSVSTPWTYAGEINAAEGLTEKPVITRAADYTGEIILFEQGTLTVSGVVLDGEKRENISCPLITAKKNGSLAANLILNNVVLRNNYNSADDSKGGAIYAENATIGQTTSNQPKVCENVIIENCSAVYGGAVYKSADQYRIYFKNSQFNNNTADTGSALFIDYGSVSNSIALDGCSFAGNVFSDSSSNTNESTKKTVIYATSAVIGSSQLLYMTGDTKFDDNDTVSDIMLDGKLAQSTQMSNFGAHDSSNNTYLKNVGSSPIRVAFGNELINRYSGYVLTEIRLISLVEDFTMKNLNESFSLVPSNGGTIPEGYRFLRHGEWWGRYATIGKPKQTFVYYNIDATTSDKYKTKDQFEKATNGAVTISQAFPEGYVAYSDRAYADEDTDYTLVAQANGAKIKSIYAKYHVYRYRDDDTKQDVYDDVQIDGTVDGDGQKATLNISMDVVNDTVAGKQCNLNVYFEYEVLAQPITIATVEGGTITTNPSGSANVGDTVTLTATPDAEYNFSSWNVYKTGDTSAKVTVSGNTFTMPSYPVTVSATFVKKTHAVTVEIQGETAGGTVSINKNSPVTVGEEVQVTVDTNAYYVLASLTMNDTDIMSSKSFTMPNKAVTITAVFEKTKYRLEYIETANGTIQGIAPNDTLSWGTFLRFTVTPNPYYVIDYVAASINDVPTIIKPEAEGKYTYTTTPADTTIIAVYKKQQFTVTAAETVNGTIKLISSSPIDWGKDFTINVKANPHYEIDTVTVDGKAVAVSELSELGDYTFTMPTHNVTISATFKKVKYTITGEGNNVTFGIPDKSTYNWGDTVEITATPDKWYSIKNVYAKGNGSVTVTKVEGKENAYTFTMPASDITIVAVAERPNFTVTFDSQGGSAVTPATVANGAALTKPAAPSWAGRGFAGWYTDAECTEKYDFTAPVTGNITLYARWFLWGDVNSDGNVDSADALLIRRCAVGLTPYSNIKNNLAGFVTGLISDSKTAPDSGDALAIRRYAVGLINRYKIEDIAAGYEFDVENNTYIPKA